MKRCLLHIGMHKTGSTTIQKNLREIRSFDGWRYITLEKGKTNLNEAMYAMFSSSPEDYHTYRNTGLRSQKLARIGARLRRRFERRIRAAEVENVILSAESLSQMDKEGVARLAEFLEPLFDEIVVIGYVRPPAGFASSSFQEKVKHGKGRFNLSDCVPRYRFRFRKFDSAFGRGRVRLYKFDPRSFPNGCVLEDFCQRTGIALPPGTVVAKVNEGLCRQACGILLAYHKHGPGYGIGKHVVRENRMIVRSLLAMRGEKFQLAGELVAPVLEAQAADVSWMEKRLGEPLGEALREDSGAVAAEDDLMNITPQSLREFGQCFGELLRVRPPRLPDFPGDRVPPETAAAYVQNCRELAGRKIRKAARPKSLLSKLLRRFRKKVRKSGRRKIDRKP
jgi:hypothetical protein